MFELDSLQSAIKLNPPKTFKRKWLWNPLQLLSFKFYYVSRFILATQPNLKFILKKWYLHARIWFASNCHKTQPSKDIQEEMVVESPSIIVLQIVLCYFSRSILATQPILALSSKNGNYMLELNSIQSAIKLNPPMSFKKKWLRNPLQLLSSKLYPLSFQDPS